MIRPIDAYPGKVAAPTTEYPDGKAQNITSPGDGTGTPWEAQLVNDLFGFQQYLAAKAGITPSGTPDNATASQQFDALWKLLNVRPITVNVASDADITLTAEQNLYNKLTVTDTGALLTTGRNVILDDIGRALVFTNSTAQTLTVKTAAGTGVEVPAGSTFDLLNDGVNVSLPPAKPGEVLQVVYTKDAASYSFNGVEFEYLNTLFTPKSATSKLIIDIVVLFGWTGNGLDGGFHLTEDGVVVETGADADTARGGNDVFFSNDTMLSDDNMDIGAGTIEVDSVDLTEREFAVTLNSGGAVARTWSINRCSAPNSVRGISTMKITEVER